MPFRSTMTSPDIPSSPEVIGKPGEDVLALAFAGGGFDTAMQLGVIHALLVSDGRPPDVVAGISVGAVNATALAEVLQAGAGLPEDERLMACVARFREVLETFQQTPEMVGRAVVPDPYEVEFQVLQILRASAVPIGDSLCRVDALAAVSRAQQAP